MSYRRTIDRQWWVIGIILVAAVLRFYGLTKQPLWYDELVGIHIATYRGGLPAIWNTTVSRFYPHPPPFMILLRLWFKGWQWAPSEFSARLPSVWASLLAFPIFYRYLSEIASERLALIALVLLAVSPSHIFYAQEARPYAWMFTLTVLTVWVLHRALKAKHALWWVAHALCLLVLLPLHYFSWCVLGGEILYMFLSWRRHRRAWLPFALSLVIPVSLAAMFVINLWNASQRVGHILVLDSLPFSISFPPTWMAMVVGDGRYAPQWIRVAGGIGFGLLVLLGLGRFVKRRWEPAMVLSLLVVPFAFVFGLLKIAGHTVPPYEDRQFLVALPFILALAAGGIEHLAEIGRARQAQIVGRGLAVTLVALLLAGNLAVLTRYYRTFDKNLDVRVIEYLYAQVQPGDVLVCNSYSMAENLAFHWDSPVPVEILSRPRKIEGQWRFTQELHTAPEFPIRWAWDLSKIFSRRRVWLITQAGFSSPEVTTQMLNLATPVHQEQFGPFSVYLLVP